MDAKIQKTENRLASFCLSVTLLMVTLMAEIITVVTQKHPFDIRDESFLVTTFWKFCSIKILIHGLLSMVFQSNPPLQEKDHSNEL